MRVGISKMPLTLPSPLKGRGDARHFLSCAVVLAGMLIAVPAVADEEFGQGSGVGDANYDDSGPAISDNRSPVKQEILVPDPTKINEQSQTNLFQIALDQARTKNTETLDKGEEAGEREIVVRRENIVMDGYPFAVLDEGKDMDQDGLSDEEEDRIGTARNNPDTDGDTYADGLEIARGYDPTKASPGDKIEYQNPEEMIGGIDRGLAVTGVRMVGSKSELLVVTGTAPPDSLVVLLVWSEEARMWVVRSDSSGRFKYSSGDTLAEGEHKIFAVQPAVNGALVSVSEAVNFRRQGSEVVVEQEGAEESNNIKAEPDTGQGLALIGILAGGLIILGIIIWLIARHWINKTRGKVKKIINDVTGRKNGEIYTEEDT